MLKSIGLFSFIHFVAWQFWISMRTLFAAPHDQLKRDAEEATEEEREENSSTKCESRWKIETIKWDIIKSAFDLSERRERDNRCASDRRKARVRRIKVRWRNKLFHSQIESCPIWVTLNAIDIDLRWMLRSIRAIEAIRPSVAGRLQLPLLHWLTDWLTGRR